MQHSDPIQEDSADGAIAEVRALPIQRTRAPLQPLAWGLLALAAATSGGFVVSRIDGAPEQVLRTLEQASAFGVFSPAGSTLLMVGVVCLVGAVVMQATRRQVQAVLDEDVKERALSELGSDIAALEQRVTDLGGLQLQADSRLAELLATRETDKADHEAPIQQALLRLSGAIDQVHARLDQRMLEVTRTIEERRSSEEREPTLERIEHMEEMIAGMAQTLAHLAEASAAEAVPEQASQVHLERTLEGMAADLLASRATLEQCHRLLETPGPREDSDSEPGNASCEEITLPFGEGCYEFEESADEAFTDELEGEERQPLELHTVELDAEGDCPEGTSQDDGLEQDGHHDEGEEPSTEPGAWPRTAVEPPAALPSAIDVERPQPVTEAPEPALEAWDLFDEE